MNNNIYWFFLEMSIHIGILFTIIEKNMIWHNYVLKKSKYKIEEQFLTWSWQTYADFKFVYVFIR